MAGNRCAVGTDHGGNDFGEQGQGGLEGLELDWVCVAWDADFRFAKNGWRAHSFRGECWQNINNAERQIYMKNAYRVLMTRARQGMVICVLEGSEQDPTRAPGYY